jgi:hypothetical protein
VYVAPSRGFLVLSEQFVQIQSVGLSRGYHIVVWGGVGIGVKVKLYIR